MFILTTNLKPHKRGRKESASFI